ncbi:MAG TPA: transaldolase [Acidimicrobiaceae bacterium]|nr:transaldolase [Acidimicrobiaceae bacterium]
MNRLVSLFEQYGQSPWLDNLKRSYLTGGELQRQIDRGIRGLTSNPTIFQKAIQGSADYDDQFRELVQAGGSVTDHYWELVLADIHGALDQFASLHAASGGGDGYVSVEVDPGLAHDGPGTEVAARALHQRVARPNLMVKIPATVEGLPAIQQMIAEGRSINVTLIFSLERYQRVMDAYIDGLDQLARDPSADLSSVASVASFFISRVDSEVDARLAAIGTPEALALRGRAAVAQAKLAYQAFLRTFSGERWDALAARGAVVQRPLWASTSTKNPDYPDTLYVDSLIGPHTVNTLPDTTVEAFADHGTPARTIDSDVADAEAVWAALAAVGVDMDDVAAKLEREGVASFQQSFDDLLAALAAKAAALA